MTGFIFRYRWVIAFFSLTIGVLSLFIIPLTEIDPEMRNYVPESISSRIATDKIEKEFGVQDMVVIMFTDDSIIDKENLNQIRNIDRAISKISGVSSRTSLFTVKSIRDEDGMMIAEPLIAGIPENAAEKKNLSDRILSNRFARGIVVSSDLTTSAITATINDSRPEEETLAKIDSVISSNSGKTVVTKGGLPYIRQNILKDVSREAMILVPAALFIMLLILKLNLGSWKSVFLPFSVVVLSTAFSMALIPLAGWKLSIIILLVPVILIAVANNYGIYLVARFQELQRQRPGSSRKELIKALLQTLNMPILFSGLTTIAGILGLLTHLIIPARQVGLLAASGVALALILSLILIPALIFISGTTNGPKTQKPGRMTIFDRILSSLSEIIVKNPDRVLFVSALVIIILSSGAFLLKINTNQENYFSKNHPIRHASGIINSKFGGSQTISVMISGDIKDPGIMQGIDRLTNDLEKQKGVGGVFSISQVVREMSKAIFTNTEDGYNCIPDTREGIAQMFELYNMSGNPDDFKQLMNLDNTKAHILIRLSEPENNIINDVKSRISRLSWNIPAEVITGGYAMIMDDFAGSIIKGQILSLLFAVVTVFLLLSIVLRSLRGGIICSIPLVASILVLFGFMGYTGIALDAATALLSSIMIGVGVDFTIQYVWCFNLQINAGLSYPDAIKSAMRTIGRSIIINALSVTTGFSALILSGFTSIRFFGYLVIISIGSCLAGALIIIPAYLMRFRPGFIGFKTISKKTRNEERSNISDVTTAAFAGSGSTT
jgi:hydrophobe/amphiphile efflux-3 (HAE3) family protein